MQVNPLMAQHEKAEESHHVLKHHNLITLFVGNTLIKPSGFNLPTVGMEYVREINHYFGVGIMAEAEIGSHIVEINEHNGDVSEVNRSGAILLIPAVFVRTVKNLFLSVGYGVELESNENLGLFKVSLEYKLAMKNDRFIVLPTVSWDHTRRFDGWVYGVNFGYIF